MATLDDLLQDPMTASQYGMLPQQGAAQAPPVFPTISSSNDALNWAAILGGLGLGLARPRVAPQALQTLQAFNTIGWREDQKEFARQRLELAQREQAIQLSNYAKMQAPEGGVSAAQPFTAPPPAMSSAQAPPETSAVPHFAAPQIPSLAAPAQFQPQSRMAEQPPQPFFNTPAQPVRGNTSTSLSAFGQSQTRSTSRGTEKEQATTGVLNDMADAILRNPEAAQKEPRRLYAEAMQRYGNKADGPKVREVLTSDFFSIHQNNLQQQHPQLDPKTLARQAYAAASRDLGPLFMPTDQMRTLATQVPSTEERRSLAFGQGDKGTQRGLDLMEGATQAAIAGSKNTADIFTKGLSPSDLQSFETPPPLGSTMGSIMQSGGRPGQRPTQAGQMGLGAPAPMSKQRQVNVEVSERERTDRQIKLEAAAPMISSIIDRAEQIRKGFSDLSLTNLYQKGKNWLDVAQSQLTGLPQTELGKLITSYDDMVLTSGPFMARSVQSNVGALTENEQAVGRLQLPRTFRELVNNPVAGNDRLAVMSLALSIDLRDPTFRLHRLDMPMSEFEKSVLQHRQKLIQTRPELFTNAPTLSAAPSIRPGSTAPPTLSGPVLTPDDQAISDQINRELQQRFQSR